MKSERNYEVNYESLLSEYHSTDSLMYKKLQIVDSYINGGGALLDIGTGTGDLLILEKQKFEVLYGIDLAGQSLEICNKRFKNESNIHTRRGGIGDLKDLFQDEKFRYITCLDVLEHIKMGECEKALNIIYDLLEDGGTFIFTGPGIFEKVRILLGRSPTHLHSHSSYGWKSMIEETGFSVLNVETVEFPLIHSDFLRKNVHVFGKCCLIVSEKVPNSEMAQSKNQVISGC